MKGQDRLAEWVPAQNRIAKKFSFIFYARYLQKGYDCRWCRLTTTRLLLIIVRGLLGHYVFHAVNLIWL